MARPPLATVVLGLVALTACSINLPDSMSGEVAFYEAGHLTRTWPLTQIQIGYMNQWLVRHKDGWRPTPVNFVPALLITLRQGGGQASTVNIQTSFVVVTLSALSYEQKFSEAELSELRGALSEAGSQTVPSAGQASIVPTNRQPSGLASVKPVVFNQTMGRHSEADDLAHAHFDEQYDVVDIDCRQHACTAPKYVGGRPGPPPPVYTGDRCVSGFVSVLYVITPEGSVVSPYLFRFTDPALSTTAIETTKKWRFEAAQVDGKPVPSIVASPLAFRCP